jgi:3-dehydroquinate synthase
MKLTYKIENQNHNIYIKKNINNFIVNEIKKLHSDKNILFVYDSKINSKIVRNLLDDLKLSGCKISHSKLQSSKKNKNQKLLFNIIDTLIEKKFSKRSIIISCGGGVISDACALAASLYLRGTYYFNIPTTMTAMIDSCIGGKTAINYNNIINCIGNYYHANSVFISNEIINSVPDREFMAGIPEILKCGIIKKNKIIKILNNNKEKIIQRDFKMLTTLFSETLKTKIFFFINDIKEKNKRLHLNFGHTFAHAIEMGTSNFKNEYLRHGEAVGIGMLCELFYSNKKKNYLFNLVENVLSLYNLPIKIDYKNQKLNKQFLQNSIYKKIFLDKKRINNNPRYIHVTKIGKPRINEIEDLNLLNETILHLM